ncbi:MAG: flavodoxin family protein [Methanoregula sp.]|nr:flavodoxin family protein [Methanoregula sp.]
MKRITGQEGELILSLDREDYSAVYPGMLRYTVGVSVVGEERALFRTNAYEYAPRVPLQAEAVAYERFAAWERELTESSAGFLLTHEKPPSRRLPASGADLIVIAGSPRADGNCGILTEWTVDAARHAGRTATVIYPHDLDIHPCIGCYQCYNTGTCTFDDDMTGIIDAIRTCRVLVITSPVYTNTVPGTLKVLIDRCQAYHAERTLFGGPLHQQGILGAVAGRRGRTHFTCVEHVVHAFMRNLGIIPAGDLLVDGTDEYRDIRTVKGLRERVQDTVRAALAGKNGQT